MNQKDSTDFDSTVPLSEQAAHWWVVLHDEACTAADHRAYAEWIAKSPERIEAYLRVTLLNRALASSEVRWPDISAETLIREARAANAEVVPIARAPAARANESKRVRVSFRPWAIAATVLIVMGSTWFLLFTPRSYRTDIGEQRSVLLDDGSVVTLNTSSTVAVDLRDKHRRVVRLERGEALFQVAHDTQRPFDVIAGNATIRAVGTEFNVDRRVARTTVTVLEGRVLVDQIPVAAAERVVVTESKVGAPERVANVAPVIAWTQRRLVFERRPLGEVAEEFNRYNRERIQIADANLEQQEVTGVFDANDAASFVTFLEQIPNVHVATSDDGTRLVTLGGPN